MALLLPNIYLQACEPGGNCCVTPKCIEKNFLSNDGINKLTKMVQKVFNRQLRVKKQLVRKIEKKELHFLDKLAKESRSPRLKKLYRQCKKKIIQDYKEQVEYEYRLDYYDIRGGYDSALNGVKRIRQTRNYRTSQDVDKLKKYKFDIYRISDYLQNRRIENYSSETSDYHFFLHRQSCDFSSLFKMAGDKQSLYDFYFTLSPQEMKSKKFQKVLEYAAASSKPLTVNLNIKCLFGKNKIKLDKKRRELYLQVKGTRKGPKGCNLDPKYVRKLPGQNGQPDINPIHLIQAAKLVH
jgi:hypothetical protein